MVRQETKIVEPLMKRLLESRSKASSIGIKVDKIERTEEVRAFIYLCQDMHQPTLIAQLHPV